MLEHYRNQSCPELAELLAEDAVTYAVLINILQDSCTDIYTDHINVIVCHSLSPYPVWVWCRDPGREENVDSIAGCLGEAFAPEDGYGYILDCGLLNHLREKDPRFRRMRMKMGLLSYRLDRLRDIDASCDGFFSLAKEEEIPYLTKLWHDLAFEMEGHDLSPERCGERVRSRMAAKSLYVWRRNDGEITALTARQDAGRYGKISAVYTLPGYRRRGYAIHLVHKVTQLILEDGRIPILYTDAGYAASNACYQKIGFREVGSLCSVCE